MRFEASVHIVILQSAAPRAAGDILRLTYRGY
jgi:hypothetical protein